MTESATIHWGTILTCMLLLDSALSAAGYSCTVRLVGGKIAKFGDCSQQSQMSFIVKELEVKSQDENNLKNSEDVMKQMTTTTTAANQDESPTLPMKARTVCKGDNQDMVAEIPDSALSASSFYNADVTPQQSRLDNEKLPWSAKYNQAGEWLQVDFGNVEQISGVVTQGRPDCCPQWVKSYKVSCGNTTQELKFIEENGTDKVFGGNTDMNTKVSNSFPQVLSCRFMRIYPQTWQEHISMRAGFICADYLISRPTAGPSA